MNIIKKIKENKRKNDSCAKIIEMDGKYINELLEYIEKQKEVLDKIKEYIKENACYDKDIKQCCRDLLTDECDYILELLEEIE